MPFPTLYLGYFSENFKLCVSFTRKSDAKLKDSG